MNKTVLGLIIAALVIFGGIGAYMMMSKPKPASQGIPTPTSNETPATQVETVTQQKSLKDLIGSGQPQECNFSDKAGNEGVVYVANSKMRGDFISNLSGQSTNSHMLIEGQTSYMWLEGQKTGFKMTMDAASQTKAGNAAKQKGIDLSEKFDYDCKPWVANPSEFILPTAIEFSDFGDLKVPSGGNIQCSACDSLPVDSQAQGKTALGCE